MSRLLLTIAFIATALCIPAASQAPVACSCSVATNSYYQENSLGSVSTDAVCTVVYPTPTTPRCEVSGTIELYFNDLDAGWSVTTAKWGDPETFFDPIEAGHMTFDHPSGTGVACGSSGTFGSYLLIVVNNPQQAPYQLALLCNRTWYCNLD